MQRLYQRKKKPFFGRKAFLAVVVLERFSGLFFPEWEKPFVLEEDKKIGD